MCSVVFGHTDRSDWRTNLAQLLQLQVLSMRTSHALLCMP